jgi:hypothetical protein
MIDLGKKNVDLLLPLEEYEPVAGNDDQEPEEQL